MGQRKTTISVSEDLHMELYVLKRKMRARSFEEVLRRLIRAYIRACRGRGLRSEVQ